MTTALLLAALAVFVAVFWQVTILAPIVLPQQAGRPNGDLYAIYHPLYTFAYRGAHLLPAWNPYQLAGTPTVGYFAGGLLYPPNALYLLLPVERALGPLVVAHLALAAAATFVLARDLRLSRAAAVLAAVGVGTNAFFVGEHLRPMYLFGLAWAPVVAVATERLVAAPNARAAGGLAAAVAMQFLTGHVQILCYELYLGLAIGVPAITLLAWRGDVDARRVVGGLALAGGVAVLLVGAQLLPTLEVVGRAVRSYGGLTIEQTLALTPSAALVRVALASSGLLGLLAVLAPASRRPARLACATCLALVVACGAIGLGTVAYRAVFYRLPGVALFRLPQEIFPIGALGLSLLAGMGLDALRSARGVPLLVAGAAAVAVGAWLAPARVAGLTVAAGALAVLAARRRPRLAEILAWLLVVGLAGERLTRPLNTVMVPSVNDAAFFADPPFVTFLRGRVGFDRVLAIKNWKARYPIMEKMGSERGFAQVQDYEPLTPAAYRDFLHAYARWDPDAPVFAGRYVVPPLDALWRPLDLMATRYVVVAPGIGWEPETPRFHELHRDPQAIVYENVRALPRALLVERHRVVADADAALRAVQEIDPRAEVVLDRDPDLSAAPEEPGVQPSAAITRLEPSTVVVDAATPRPALLVLADLYWPGWRATVDGAPAEIYRANHLFRAVAVPPGRHVVTFSYVPRPLLWGAVTSLAGLVALGALLAPYPRRRKGPTAARALTA